MSHARLTFLAVASASLLISGCAGPAWFMHGELSAPGERRSSTASHATITAASETANQATATSSDAEPSLSQVLDDLERIKQQNPSDFAVIQSAVEDTSSLFPPQYQQTFKDQMLGMALRQQEQAAQPLVESPAAQPIQSSTHDAPVVQTLPRQVSVPVALAAAAHSLDASPDLLTPTEAIPPTAAVSAQVSDMQPVQPPIASPTNSEPVTVTETIAAEELDPGQWNREIEQALTSLSADLARPNLDRDEKARLEIMRRLLYVATNQRDLAVSPIELLDEDEREYWKHQIHGLLVSIDADGKHPTTRRAALALRNLRTATDHLANVSTLDVRSLTFCKEVLSYGEYRVFDSYSFRANEEVVMYVEVDNFAAHPRGDSFETELHSSYEIVDDAGRRVASVVLPVDKQVSNNRRRDYFIAYLITLPTQIASGSYRLRLTVEDIIGKKSNHAAVDFRIK